MPTHWVGIGLLPLERTTNVSNNSLHDRWILVIVVIFILVAVLESIAKSVSR